jgi:hypothetical protein
MMTKKHYQAFARALHRVPMYGVDEETGAELVSRVSILAALNSVFKQDNCRFEPSRFYEAVTTGTCKGMR